MSLRPELFTGFESGVLLATEAVLLIVAPFGVKTLTLATIVIEAGAPQASARKAPCGCCPSRRKFLRRSKSRR